MARYGQAQNHQGEIRQILQQNFDPNDPQQCQKLAVHAVQLVATIAAVGDDTNGRTSPQQFEEIEQRAFSLAQTLGLDAQGEMSQNQVFQMLSSSPAVATSTGVWGSGQSRSSRRSQSSQTS